MGGFCWMEGVFGKELIGCCCGFSSVGIFHRRNPLRKLLALDESS
jgi:hypothetical protein